MSGLLVTNLMCVIGVNVLFFFKFFVSSAMWLLVVKQVTCYCLILFRCSQTSPCCIRLCQVRWLGGGCWGGWSSAGAVTLARLRVLWGGLSFLETLKLKSVNGNACALCGLSCFLQSPHGSTCWSESFHACIQTSASLGPTPSHL